MRRGLLTGLLVTLTIGAGTVVAAPGARAASLPICGDYAGIFHSTDSRYVGFWPIVAWGVVDYQCNLERGAGETFAVTEGTRDAVRQLQRSINACYPGAPNTPLQVDGRYGRRTTEAVTWVQRQIGVAADGEAGPITRTTMLWAWWRSDGVTFTCHGWWF